MKSFLTEWLITHGTGGVVVETGGSHGHFMDTHRLLPTAINDKFIMDATPRIMDPYTYQITPKGLEYLKDESIPD